MKVNLLIIILNKNKHLIRYLSIKYPNIFYLAGLANTEKKPFE